MAVTGGRGFGLPLLENMACDMKLLVHPTCNHYMHFARGSKHRVKMVSFSFRLHQCHFLLCSATDCLPACIAEFQEGCVRSSMRVNTFNKFTAMGLSDREEEEKEDLQKESCSCIGRRCHVCHLMQFGQTLYLVK